MKTQPRGFECAFEMKLELSPMFTGGRETAVGVENALDGEQSELLSEATSGVTTRQFEDASIGSEADAMAVRYESVDGSSAAKRIFVSRSSQVFTMSVNINLDVGTGPGSVDNNPDDNNKRLEREIGRLKNDLLAKEASLRRLIDEEKEFIMKEIASVKQTSAKHREELQGSLAGTEKKLDREMALIKGQSSVNRRLPGEPRRSTVYCHADERVRDAET